jgi:hypothetical protein
MTSRSLDRVHTTFGWTAEDKTPAEIAGDIRQTKYRLSADVDAIKRNVARKARWPVAAVGLALLALLIRRVRR